MHSEKNFGLKSAAVRQSDCIVINLQNPFPNFEVCSGTHNRRENIYFANSKNN